MKYAFFPGCAHDASAGYKESLDAVCNKLEIELEEIEDWNCCGATIAAGESQVSSLFLAARSFALCEKMGYTRILTGCNACYTTLKKAAGHLETSDQMEAANQHLAQEGLKLTKPFEIIHIMDVIFEQTPESVWQSYAKSGLEEVRVASYYGCQYTRPWVTGIESEHPVYMENFFNKLGFNAVDHSAKTICCGAAGAMPNAKIAEKLVERIVAGVKKENADTIVTICPLCQFNVDSCQTRPEDQKVPVLFFTQLLGLYLGIDPEKLGMDRLLVDADRLIRKMKTTKTKVAS